MAENSKIAWTTHTFNPWIGCTRVSPGCENCYAENLMDRRYGRVEWGPGKPRSLTKTWNKPLQWQREAARTGIRPKVFCASLADYLDDEVPDDWRQRLCTLVVACPDLDWLMLTKRIDNYRTMAPASWLKNPPPHVWLGVTAENQKWWDKRVPELMSIPAAVRWVSYEPALGPIHLGSTKPNWVIIGGESAQTSPARPFHVEWVLDVIDQCRAIGAYPFVKQFGDNPLYKGQPYTKCGKAGSDPAEWPVASRVREFPPSPGLLLQNGA